MDDLSSDPAKRQSVHQAGRIAASLPDDWEVSPISAS